MKIRLLAFLLLSLIIGASHAQEKRKVVQVGGLIVTGDSAYGVPGVHIYVNGSGIGRGNAAQSGMRSLSGRARGLHGPRRSDHLDGEPQL